MSTVNNQPLAKPLRSQLENTVKAARDIAEKAAQAALNQMGVGDDKAPSYLSDELKALRRRLRAHGRALGDTKAKDDIQGLQHLIWEVAYEHWHRMLFARFLAENGLLMWEPGAAVSLEDCEALVQESDPVMNLGAKTQWELAGKLAARMLPQVFKPQSPVFELAFAPEHQRELERLLAGLPIEVFKASDSLGWVYQFWQAKRKDNVNASEVKIGADELPAVTQLFTEPYMVDFLLHNSLGAWWVTRHPDKACPVPLNYLRTLENGTPAAGKFEGWPERLDQFKLLDPCCGSGHFLVAAFLLLAPMRMEAEGLSAMEAVDAVLADNLHGLELDPRCVEIAVFALALAAWRFPDQNGEPLGVRSDMPSPQIACCGLKVAAKPENWMALVPDEWPNADFVRQELQLLHASFTQAPLLGSLLDPLRVLKNDLATSSIDTLRELLERALSTERPPSQWGQASELQDDAWDSALTARGLLEAARLLNTGYDLVITNVPYLKSGNHSDALKNYLDTHYPCSIYDLATVFMERCLELTNECGHSAIVTQQYWLFLKYYESLREKFINERRIDLLAILGPGAFESISGEVVNPCLQIYSQHKANANHPIHGLDVSKYKKASEKADFIQLEEISTVLQSQQKHNPNSRISLSKLTIEGESPLSKVADFGKGSVSGDGFHYVRCFWELGEITQGYRYWLNSPEHNDFIGGRQHIVLWSVSGHDMTNESGCRIHGQRVWKKKGIAIGKAGKLRPTLYAGELFDDNLAVVVPYNQENLEALWNFCVSPDFELKLKQLDKKMSVTAGTFTKVSVDLDLFNKVPTTYSLPVFQSSDPTQWLFHGHPQSSNDPLQVAVARLVGYHWPAETDTSMELSDEARSWIARCEQLAEHTDDDGIVCLPSVRGEPAAHDRLLKLLIAAWETVQPGSWKPAVLNKLLADADWAGKGLDTWLREKFFEQHAKRFHHRPFIWHVWDGQKDGFAALVNYHRLDAKNLERLIHTYLGDWVRQQEGGVRDGVDGAPTRLAAAQDLKRRLELILEGEKPYDIFVRWKPLAEQAIGWNPDLNDGVRMNIRPFMTTEVLRHNKKPKLNITWDKDRGKDVETAPWFHKFEGDRINDHHLTLAEKMAAKG